MAWTDHANPPGERSVYAGVQVSDYLDYHNSLHARHLSNRENVRAHSALGNAADNDNDTNATVKAINNLIARGGQAAGQLDFGTGWFVQNGDTIDALLTGRNGWRFIGEGPQATTLAVRTGAGLAFGGTGLINCYFEGITFVGSGAAKAFRLRGNSQNNTFVNCVFKQGTVGMSIEANGGNDQADKNTYIGCVTANNTTGMHVNSGNAQQQLWIGGQHSSNGVSVRTSHGWYHQIGGQIQHSGGVGTAYQLDTGATKLILDDVITEAENISIDVQGISTPAIIDLRNCTFGPQTSPKIVKGSGAGSFKLIAQGCTFNTGPIEVGVSSVFQDIHNVYAGGAAWTPNTNAIRYQWTDQGLLIFYGSTTSTRFISPEGYEDWDDMAAPASPAAGKVREFHNSATGKLSVKDSAGVVTALY